MLIDDGVIVTDSEPWRVAADKLLDVRVPSTLAGVLQARIDGLPPAEKAALQQASVVGHVFWDEALQRIAPLADDALDGLMRRELAYGRETSAFEGTREFVFKHHVLHQVAYQGVLKQSRREQHRLTADWLVVRSGDRASEYFGLIAEHYERAGDVANAVEYLRRAGEDAARSYVNQAALDFLGRALALVPDDDAKTRFELLSTRRSVYSNTGRRDEQEADVRALEQLAEQIDDAARARASGFRTSFALVTGDYPATAAAAARTVELGAASGERGAVLLARLQLGARAAVPGRRRECAAAHRAVARAGARDRRPARRELDPDAARHPRDAARPLRLARGYYQQALELARAIGHRSVESGVINNLGETEQPARQLRRRVRAVPVGPAPVRRDRPAHGRFLPALQHGAHRRIARPGGRGDRLDDRGERNGPARQGSRPAGEPARRARPCAQGARRVGRGGRVLSRGAIAIYREIGRPTMPPEPIAGLARLALARGDTAAALATIAEVVAHFDGGGSVDGTEDPLWIYLTCHQVLPRPTRRVARPSSSRRTGA